MTPETSSRRPGAHAIGATVIAAISVAAFFVIVQPALRMRIERTAMARERVEQLRLAEELDQTRTGLRGELGHLEQQLAASEIQLQSSSYLNARIAHIIDHASRGEVDIHETRPGVIQDHQRYQTVPILLAGRGSYSNCAAFLHRLALRRLSAFLEPGGRIVLRESTVRRGVEPKTGSYQVVYRSSAEYTTMIGESGLALERVELNAGYAAMEMAVAIVDALRTLPVLSWREPSIVGRPVWQALRAAKPLSFKIVPGLLERLGVAWPHLQNHFFLVRDPA